MPTTTVTSPTGDQLLALGVLLGRSGKIIESEISGSSMGSALPARCRIHIRPLPIEEYRPGQVVAFISGNAILAHRIIFRSRQGALTRGDNRSWCDLPVPWRAILGLVAESQLDGEWRSLSDHVPFHHERGIGRRAVETLLRLCLQIDIRLARCASRTLFWVARWRHRLASGNVWTHVGS
jgi:hypothetical protein